MNSGLPSLLDAIFGKQILDSVSIDEIYELINEFPSFNAGHFLLSKKLKEQEDAGYEKETMRTALYFNNPFWLESVLNVEDHLMSGNLNPPIFREPGGDFSRPDSFSEDSGANVSEISIEEFITEPDIEKIVEIRQSVQEQPLPEYIDGPVKSFDDLISKYQIAPLTTGEETFAEPTQESVEQTADTTQSAEKMDFREGNNQVVEEEPGDTLSEAELGNLNSGEIAGDYEIREEVVNEYGIFEEVKVKRSDLDLEAFDRPVTQVSEDNEKPNNSTPDVHMFENASVDDLFPNEIPEVLNESKDENPVREDSDQEKTQEDYESFDRPVESPDSEETESPSDLMSEEESISEIYSGQEHRLESIESDGEADDIDTVESRFPEADSGNDQMPGLAARFGEQQKIITPFDPKKAESIVFAPYHMIDYFASQGIKLVLEENPADPFARQLKSFTDWLKVMKRLPVKSMAEKTDEKEADRIRHFAAHSIDEREILTESMAEVLAKQGMYENAIALFQKLSLIYPPKSAYFASRIEQLKASLP